jgi:hypothetical protein
VIGALVRRGARTDLNGNTPMRWLIVFLLACLVFNGLQGWLRKIGLGRLPGDFSLRFRGREWYFPVASSLLLTVPMMLIGLLL